MYTFEDFIRNSSKGVLINSCQLDDDAKYMIALKIIKKEFIGMDCFKGFKKEILENYQSSFLKQEKENLVKKYNTEALVKSIIDKLELLKSNLCSWHDILKLLFFL